MTPLGQHGTRSGSGRATPSEIVRRGRDQLLVNAGSLMFSSLATGALGLVYWIVAGRLFAAADVGRASALISTATMLSSIACLSLGGSYQRFLPLAGHRTAVAIVGGYVVSAVTAVVLGAAFAWSPMANQLLSTDLERSMFTLMVAVFAFYALTDSILTGLGKAPSVAAKNVTASVGKIVPLMLLTPAIATGGIVASWTGISLSVAVVFAIVALRDAAGRQAMSLLPAPRELLAYQSAFLVMMLVAAALPLALPLLVVHQMGTAENAYFNLAWTMCAATALLRAAVGSAFIVEASTPGADRRALLTRIMPVYAGVSLVAGLGLAVGGPLVLLAAGEDYFRAAWPLMVLMGAVVVLESLVGAYYVVAQLLRQLKLMTATQFLCVVITIVGSYLLLPRVGVIGVGIAEGIAMASALLFVGRPLARGVQALRTTDRTAPTSATAGGG